MSKNEVPLSENEYVKGLFSILQDNGKDTSGLEALLNHVSDMENFVKAAEDKIVDMKSQIDSMKEIQNHPIKNALKNAVKVLESKVASVKTQLAELKTNIVQGCKNAVVDFQKKGISAINNLASFFGISKNLQNLKKSIDGIIAYNNKTVAKIETFSKEYHSAGRSFKNMARIVIGKEPIDVKKEAGKLAKTLSTAYKMQNSVLTGLNRSIDKAGIKIKQLENVMQAKHEQPVTAKKTTLMERLAEKREMIKQNELKTPKIERTPKAQGVEI